MWRSGHAGYGTNLPRAMLPLGLNSLSRCSHSLPASNSTVLQHAKPLISCERSTEQKESYRHAQLVMLSNTSQRTLISGTMVRTWRSVHSDGRRPLAREKPGRRQETERSQARQEDLMPQRPPHLQKMLLLGFTLLSPSVSEHKGAHVIERTAGTRSVHGTELSTGTWREHLPLLEIWADESSDEETLKVIQHRG